MDNEIIANIKSLGIDMISEAKSGHPGIVLGAAPIIYTLYSKHMNISTNDEKWANRDRFIMSAGHGSALLYATLFMAGYDISLDDLKHFRKVGYKTPGHPEYSVTPGVDMSTGPLGQGFASAVGMAIAEKKLNEELRIPKKSKFEINKSLVDHFIYVLCGDGDLMEGVSSESASIAGNLELNNLIVLYDSNNISLDGSTELSLKENVLEKFKSLNWNTIYVKNGNDVREIDRAILKAKNSNKPTIIEIKTIIGNGSFAQGTSEVHGKPLTKEDTTQIKKNLNILDVPFYVNEESKNNFKKQIMDRSNLKYKEWANNYVLYKNNELNVDHNNYDFVLGEQKFVHLNIEDFHFEDLKEPTRKTNQIIISEIAKKLPNFIGGTADVSKATFSYLNNFGDISSNNFKGRNIFFGVREHAMGAILNGLALYNYQTFGSTFLSFSDYMKPAIRMSALIGLPVTYIFTHDSILVGEDGPTHQPIEQLAMLRATPNLNVFRPCDANELVECWNTILNIKNKPSCLILSRNDVENLTLTKKANVEKGAYILKKEEGTLNGILISTGTELSTALTVSSNLKRKFDLNLRVVSMPCMELFIKQTKAYQDEILPIGFKKIVIEAGSSFGWEKFVYNNNYLITLDKFGVSGSKDEVLKYMDFDYNSIEERIIKLIK